MDKQREQLIVVAPAPTTGNQAPVTQIYGRGSQPSIGRNLLKNEADDSALKKVVVWGLAIGGAYFGGTFLLKNISKAAQKAREENALAETLTQAATGKNPTATLAQVLVLAINPQWAKENPKQVPSRFVDCDEATIFRLLAGPSERSWSGQMVVKEYKPVINTLESYNATDANYRKLTGRTLDADLFNYLDWVGTSDYNALKPYVDKTKCYRRRIDPKTKKAYKVYTCAK